MTTSIEQWRESRLHEMTLPSGNVMKVKRLGLMDLISQGDIPDTLGPLAAELASKQQVRALSLEELKRYADIVNLVVKAAAEEPKVTDQPGPATLGAGEIEFVDRVEIYKWANGGATTLRPFRGEKQSRTFPAS